MDDKLTRLLSYIEEFPTRKEAFYLLGDYYKQLNLFDEAKKYYLLAIKLDPDFFGAYLDLVEIFLIEDNITEADLYMTTFINRNAENVDYYFVLTKLFKRFNQLELALKYLKITLSIRIYNYEIFKEIADVHFLLSNYEKAIIFYNRALNINLHNPIIIFHLVMSYFFLHKADKAIEILKDFSKTNKLTEEMLTFLSNLKNSHPEFNSDISILIEKAYLDGQTVSIA